MHALLLQGTFTWALTELPDDARVEGVDVTHARGVRMGIDDARTLIREANLSPLAGTIRTFVIAYDDITIEAQNALLKLLEEPPRTSCFYIIQSQTARILPTLRSRLVLWKTEVQETDRTVCDTFLRASYSDRLSDIASRVTKKDDAWVHALMDGIERYAEEKGHAELIRTVLDIRAHIERPGSSKKMLLEHVALLVE